MCIKLLKSLTNNKISNLEYTLVTLDERWTMNTQIMVRQMEVTCKRTND